MKKIAIWGLLLCILCAFVPVSATCLTDDPDTNQEIKITVIVIGGDTPRPRPRSGAPIITAELSGGQLSFAFNEQVGTVTVSVENSMGEIVSLGVCDTDNVPFFVLSVPVDTEDFYRISIIGDSIEAVGTYDTFR